MGKMNARVLTKESTGAEFVVKLLFISKQWLPLTEKCLLVIHLVYVHFLIEDLHARFANIHLCTQERKISGPMGVRRIVIIAPTNF